jgi:hypothetical protein
MCDIDKLAAFFSVCNPSLCEGYRAQFQTFRSLDMLGLYGVQRIEAHSLRAAFSIMKSSRYETY